MTTLANKQIQGMKPYAPPLEGRRKYKGVLCDFNERTIPVSPKVLGALRDLADQNQLQVYPEYGTSLQEKIAKYVGVTPAQVMVTNGSDQGIDLIFRTFTREGDSVVIPSPSFAMFYQCAGVVGNKSIEPEYELPDLAYPTSKVLQEIKNGAKLIVICNPNNPTGTLLQLPEIEKILQEAAKMNCVVYVDEAYAEFSGVSAAGLIPKYSNLLITRTFSKAFGLPSLRVGYVLSNEANILELQKVRGPYDVNMAGFVAASAALDELEGTQEYVKEVMFQAKPMVEKFFREQKIPFYFSGSNFILFKPKNATKIFEILKDNGFLTRPRSGPNIDGTLRLTIGTVSQMDQFMRTYSERVLRKIAFLDRDGALIFEPQDTFQIDSIEKLQILPGVLEGLQALQKGGFELVMVSNQDGLGTESFPKKDFEAPQNKMLTIFEANGIKFSRVFVCPHFKEANCACRKPKTGLVDEFMREIEVDMAASFMYGDRETDRQFAENLGIRFIKADTNGLFQANI